jgi:hypothetical protein
MLQERIASVIVLASDIALAKRSYGACVHM